VGVGVIVVILDGAETQHDAYVFADDIHQVLEGAHGLARAKAPLFGELFSDLNDGVIRIRVHTNRFIFRFVTQIGAKVGAFEGLPYSDTKP